MFSFCVRLADVGKRQDSRDRIESRIIELGRRHLETDGASGLSLRAIARDLGMVSSAVYRYVPSRDELLTLLLVDAYTELADVAEAARAAAGADWREQIKAIGRAARAWALGVPACWALLYGSPVPGYHAPAESTVGPGTRVVGLLFDAVSAGIAAGDIRSSGHAAPQTISADFAQLRDEFGFSGDDDAVTRCFVLWAAIVGAISLEVFGQYGADTLSDPAGVFDLQLDVLVNMLAA